MRGIAAGRVLAALLLFSGTLLAWLILAEPGVSPREASPTAVVQPPPATPRDAATPKPATSSHPASTPSAAKPHATGTLPPLQQDFYVLRTESIGDGRRHYIRNLIAGPLQFELRFDQAEGVVSNPTLPLHVMVPALEEIVVVDVTIAPGASQARFSLVGEAVPGVPDVVPWSGTVYRVPFKRDAAWSLDQGFDGPFSHRDVQARYALDFGVDEGTPVLAARGGTVMHVRDDFEAASTADEGYAERANTVRILHEDGTMGVYAHLSPRSALVHAGQRVVVGTPLALSGNTGFSTGPHLHFAVQRNAGMKLESVPFDMEGVDERRPD